MRLRRGLGERHRPAAPMPSPGQLHLSLNFLGAGAPAAAVDAARQAAAAVKARPFLVDLNHVVSFKPDREGRRALVLRGEEGVAGVFALHSAIHRALADRGLARRRERDIDPHLTLWRDAVDVGRQYVEPVRWIVRDFALVHGRRGAGHEVLGRWRFAAPAVRLRAGDGLSGGEPLEPRS